jgi:hypothetical protein
MRYFLIGPGIVLLVGLYFDQRARPFMTEFGFEKKKSSHNRTGVAFDRRCFTDEGWKYQSRANVLFVIGLLLCPLGASIVEMGEAPDVDLSIRSGFRGASLAAAALRVRL